MAAQVVVKVDPVVSGIASDDLLRYFYYGGVIHCGLKEWRGALECFRCATTLPAIALSAISVESFKKMALVSLIVHGKKVELPAYTPKPMSNFAKSGSDVKAYEAIAAKFGEESPQALEDEVERHAVQLGRDRNYGLAKQVLFSGS